MDKLLDLAAVNQQRARDIIRDTDLEAAWQSVGAEPNMVGSLRTGLLMTHRDIDFHIYSSPLCIEDSFAAMTRLARHPRIRDGVRTYPEFEAWRADNPVTGILEWMP